MREERTLDEQAAVELGTPPVQEDDVVAARPMVLRFAPHDPATHEPLDYVRADVYDLVVRTATKRVVSEELATAIDQVKEERGRLAEADHHQ